MRLIDADEAREKMLKLLDHHLMMCNYSADSATQDCIEVINEATVVDAVPVVHGRWIYLYDDDHTIAVCSNCKGVVYVNDAYNLLPPIDEVKYCYHCGAKMDEVMSDG